MNEDEYTLALTAALTSLREPVRMKIIEVLARQPDKTRRLDFVIFPGPDQEGDFSVQASLEGPDLYVLNKAIEPHARLIAVKHTSSGFDPAVPALDPFDTEFDADEVISRCVAGWLRGIWNELQTDNLSIPVRVTMCAEYGTKEISELNGQS